MSRERVDFSTLVTDAYPHGLLQSSQAWSWNLIQWAYRLPSLERTHSGGRSRLIESLERVELEQERALLEFMQNIGQPAAEIFYGQLRNMKQKGSWVDLYPRPARALLRALDEANLDPRLAKYRGEFECIARLARARKEDEFHAIGADAGGLMLEKYSAGECVIFIDTHSYKHDERSLAGKMVICEPDIRLYAPSVKSEQLKISRQVVEDLRRLHPERIRNLMPMHLTYLASVGWLHSMTSGEALYHDAYMLVENLQKDRARLSSVRELLVPGETYTQETQAFLELLAWRLIEGHEGSHLYFWEGDTPYEQAIWAECFADVPSVIACANDMRFSAVDLVTVLLASYGADVAFSGTHPSANQRAYLRSSNLVFAELTRSGLVRCNDSGIEVDESKRNSFCSILQEVHEGLWRKNGEIMRRVARAYLPSDAIKLGRMVQGRFDRTL